jgi:hypothetical protein
MAVISLGISRIEPEKSDRQFIHPAWRGQTGYRRLSQAYLAWSRSVNGLADRLETPDWRTREQLRFVLELCTSGASPTNCLLGNPAALQKALDSGGTSLLRGAKNWLHDVLHNRGMPTQVDSSSFKVGENLALTPGSVVYRGERTLYSATPGISPAWSIHLATPRHTTSPARFRPWTQTTGWRWPVSNLALGGNTGLTGLATAPEQNGRHRKWLGANAMVSLSLLQVATSMSEVDSSLFLSR